jgi:hypothetical protein
MPKNAINVFIFLSLGTIPEISDTASIHGSGIAPVKVGKKCPREELCLSGFSSVGLR